MDVLEELEQILTFGGEDEDLVDKGSKAACMLVNQLERPKDARRTV